MGQAEIIEVNLSAQAKRKAPIGNAWALNVDVSEVTPAELLKRDAQGFDLIQLLTKDSKDPNKRSPVGFKWRSRK